MTDEIEFREFQIEYREESEEGVLEGIAVPWDQTINVGGKYRERFKRGAIVDDGNIKLFRDHKELIGHVIETEDREEGFWFRAKVALTALGKDTLALLRSGALSKLSVSFIPQVDERDQDVIVRSRVSLQEISVVMKPAYANANVLSIREHESTVREDLTDAHEEARMTEESAVSSADLTEVRSAIEDLDRKFEVFSTRPAETVEVADNRSAAEALQAIVRGDQDTIESYNRAQEDRAYTGSVVADGGSSNKPAWLGDLTRIFDGSSGVLTSIFDTGSLPDQGMSVEYGQLQSNTVTVGVQANEGDALPYGKVQLTTATAPVQTVGGYVQLSRQAIERSTLPLLQDNLNALALAAGANMKLLTRGGFSTLVTQQTAATGGAVVLGSAFGSATYNNYVNATIDAAVKFSQNNLNLDVLIVSTSVFKKFSSLNGTDGRPMLTFDGSGANTIGRLNVTGLTGSFINVPVVMDPDQVGDSAVFADKRAVRVLTSPLVNLSDQNPINLTNTYSVYRYVAIATPYPAGLVPLKLSAS